MERTKKTLLTVFLLICCAALLLLVNRDLFSYRFDRLCRMSFTPESVSKGTYRLAELPVLKPGEYSFSFDGSADASGSYLVLLTEDDSFYDSYKLTGGTENPVFALTVATAPVKLYAAIQYDPISGDVSFRMLHLSGEHVLYKESLLRHLVLSMVIGVICAFLFLRIQSPERFFRIFPRAKDPVISRALLLMLGLTLLTSYPLLDPRTYANSEDMFFHLTRIEGLAESLKAGYFPVKNQLYWLRNYGYGCGFFYPDLFLYIPAFFRILGFSLLGVYKAFLIGCTFFALFTTRAAAYRITGSPSAGITAMIFQAFSAYRLINIYYRGTVGETQALIFLPLIIWGVYEIFHDHPERWPLFALGFWGLLSSHMITLALAGLITGICLLFRLRTILRDRRILSALLKSVLVVVCLGASFIVPMIEQTQAVPDLRLNLNVISNADSFNFNLTMPFRNLFLRFHAWNNWFQWQSVYPGLSFLLVPLAAALTIRKERTPGLKAADRMLFLGIVLLLIGTDIFPWKYFGFLASKIQFAWRFMLPVSALFPICGGIYFSAIFRERKGIPLILAFVCFGLSAYPILRETVQNRTISKDLFVMQDNRVSQAEYLPEMLFAEFIDKNRDTVLCSDPSFRVTAHDRRKLSFSFTYECGTAEELDIIVPFVYYKGFQGTLTAPDGSVIKLPVFEAENGLTAVTNNGYSSGTIRVRFGKTPLQRISEGITLCTLAVLILIIRRRCKTSKD